MAEIENIGLDQLLKAAKIWAVSGAERSPEELENEIIARFDKQTLEVIQRLEDEFCESDACYKFDDTDAIKERAKSEFRESYPNLPEEILEVFAWSYMYQNR